MTDPRKTLKMELRARLTELEIQEECDRKAAHGLLRTLAGHNDVAFPTFPQPPEVIER